MSPLIWSQVPDPGSYITDAASKAAGFGWDRVTEGITKWVLDAVDFFVKGIADYLANTVRPDLGAAWFSGAGSPYATVRNFAGLLLLAFVLLGIIQGLFAGDVATMITRVARDLPAAIIGMVATTVVVGKLIELTDGLSLAVMQSSGTKATEFLSGFGAQATQATNGFAAVLLGLVAVVAALLVWVELIVRSVLVYVIVALSPLSFAAMVWPATRGILRRMVEVLFAVIVSKLVICIALAVGIAALGGAGSAGPADASAASSAGASVGALFTGAAVLAMAAFAPFLVLKLIPWAEGAVVAQGISHSPGRAANSAMGTSFYARSLTRLGGGSGGGGNGEEVFELPAGDTSSQLALGSGSETGASAAAGAEGAAGGAGAGAGASVGASVAGGAVTGGVLLAVEGGRQAVDSAKSTASQGTDFAAGGSAGEPAGAPDQEGAS